MSNLVILQRKESVILFLTKPETYVLAEMDNLNKFNFLSRG